MISKMRRLLIAAPAVAALAGFAFGFGGAAEAAKYRIGFTVGDIGNPFHTRVYKTAQAVAAENDVELILLDTKRDLATESNNIDLLITQQVDLIMVMATSAEGSIAGLDRAIDAGIPVMTVLDSAVGSGEKYTYVGSDFEDWGEFPVGEMARLLDGKGNIVYIKGGAGFLVEHNRDNAFKAAIASHPDLHVVFEQHGDWNKPSGVTIMEDALSRFPEAGSIQGVIAHNDNMALGAVEALKRAGRLEGVVVGGSDGNADALQSIIAGELTYTTFQDGEAIGREAINTALKILNGEDAPKLVGIPWVLIADKDTAATYLKNVYGIDP
jgi:ABC-type sugar transport system substrate-binding protein